MIIRFELYALGPYVSAAHWFVQGYGADFVSWLIYCLAAGVGAVLVGMIAFGSSLVILPVLLLIFPTQFDPEVGVRLAVGTTMASMVFGALSAGFAQTRHRTVCWPLLRLMIPAYLVGAVLGPWLSRYLPVEVLGYYIVSILVVVSIQTLRRRQPVGERRWEQARVEISLVHLVIGLMSSVAGIASGAFAIPYLSRFALSLANRDWHLDGGSRVLFHVCNPGSCLRRLGCAGPAGLVVGVCLPAGVRGDECYRGSMWFGRRETWRTGV